MSFQLVCIPGAQSQRATPAEEDARFDAVAQRYRQALQSHPYRGPTFDYWYRHYLDAGKLDRLVSEVESAARTAPDEATRQVILGLVYERKGRDDDAARRISAARKLVPDRYEPPALLGTLLARLSRFEEAAPALVRCDRPPSPAQRAARPAQAARPVLSAAGQDERGDRDVVGNRRQVPERPPRPRGAGRPASATRDRSTRRSARWEQVVSWPSMTCTNSLRPSSRSPSS